MDRVELIIQLTGDKEALSSLRSVKAAVDQLKNTKVQLRIDRLDVEREISRVKRQIDDLTNKKREVKLDGGDVKAVERDIINARKELAELTERKRSIDLEMKGAEIAAQQARELEKGLSNAENTAQRLGGALQSVGGAMQSVGSMLKSVSGIFTNNNIVDTLERYATVMASRMFTQNWGKAFQRYDILSTYSDYLDMVGVSADDASASINKLNAGIQGIPVGLNDVAYQTRMYQMYVDDLERATNLAIGLERALVAGGANEQMRNTARYEIDRLLSAGQLSTSRQYRALMQGLGVSSRYLREEMGYGAMSNAEFINALFKRQISGDELIRGIESLASSDKLNNAIEVYRTTIESGLSNIQFALTRGKANILSALNESLTAGTGKNISGWLYQIRDAINEIYKSAASWVSANPVKIADFIDTLGRIFDRIRSLDWEAITEGILDGFEKLIDVFIRVFNTIDLYNLFEPLIVFSTVWAGPIGDALIAVGGALIVFGKALEIAGGAFAKFNGGSSAFASIIGGPGFVAAIAGLSALALVLHGINDNDVSSIADRLGLDSLKGYDDDITSVTRALEAADKALKTTGGTPEKRIEATVSAQERVRAAIEETQDAWKAVRDEYNKLVRAQEEAESKDWGEIDFMSGREDYSAEIDTAKRALDGYTQALDDLKQSERDLIEQEKRLREEQENPPLVRNYVQSQDEQVVVDTEQAEQALDNLIKKYTELREAAEKSIEAQVKGFEEMNIADTVGIDTLTQNLQSQADALTHFADNLGQLERYAKEISELEGGEEAGRLLAQIASEISAQGLDGAGYAQGVNDAIKKAFETGEWDAVDALLNAFQAKQDASEGAIDMTAFAQTVAENFNESPSAAFDNLEEFGLVEKFVVGADEAELAEQITVPLTGAYDTAKAQIQSLVDSSGPLISISDVLDDKQFEETKQPMVDRVTEMAKAMQEAMNETLLTVDDGEEDGSASLASGFRAVQAQVMLIVEESLPALVTAMEDTSRSSVEAIQQIIRAVNELIQAIMRLISVLEALRQKFSQVAYEGVSAFNRIKQSVQEVLRAVQDLINKLNELKQFDGMSININVHGMGGVPEGAMNPDSSAYWSTRANTGGLIGEKGGVSYYARGGFAKGTDTIPAMLTPGEYVMRREAVNRLGVPFLQMLNRLDIGNAFDAIMSRVYRPMVTPATAYNYYNTNTDNRKYSNTQHIHTNNPDFAYRIANRFAHAL